MNLDEYELEQSVETWILDDSDAALAELGEDMMAAIGEELGDD